MTACAVLALAALAGCQSEPPRLKTIGQYQLVTRAGQTTPDTVWPTVPRFALTDQYGKAFTSAEVAGKIYVVDFFFATCPTICPVVKKDELRLWQQYKNDPRVVFVSHTIDPRHDTVAVLSDYADRLGVNHSNWHFVTGPRDTIFSLAQHYLVAAQEDTGAAGGFTHSDALVLVDTRGRLRGSLSPNTGAPVYAGLVPADVDRLIRDVGILLKEEFPARR